MTAWYSVGMGGFRSIDSNGKLYPTFVCGHRHKTNRTARSCAKRMKSRLDGRGRRLLLMWGGYYIWNNEEGRNEEYV